MDVLLYPVKTCLNTFYQEHRWRHPDPPLLENKDMTNRRRKKSKDATQYPQRRRRGGKQTPRFDPSGGHRNYFDPKHPESFSAISGFLVNNKNIDKEKFQKWALGEDAITLHQPTRKRFPRRRVLVFEAGDLLQIDLMDFQSLSKFNRGYNFVLTAIDVFSKFAFALPIKRKTAKEVLRALKTIVKDMKPKKIQSDRGLEFVNQTISDWAKANGIVMYSSFNFDINNVFMYVMLV